MEDSPASFARTRDFIVLREFPAALDQERWSDSTYASARTLEDLVRRRQAAFPYEAPGLSVGPERRMLSIIVTKPSGERVEFVATALDFTQW